MQVIIDQALVNRATTAYKQPDGAKEIVILLRILVHDCNYGYKLTNGMAMVLDELNSTQISSELCGPHSARGHPARQLSEWCSDLFTGPTYACIHDSVRPRAPGPGGSRL